MKKITAKRDGSLTKRIGIASTILGFLGGTAAALATAIQHNPIYVYSLSAVGAFIGFAGVAITVYGARKDGSEKKIIEFETTAKVRVPEKKLVKVTNKPEFWVELERLEKLETDQTYYITIDSRNEELKVYTWQERCKKHPTYTLRESSELEV